MTANQRHTQTAEPCQKRPEVTGEGKAPRVFTIDKQTAKDICAVRRAQHIIDAIELGDEWGKFKPPDSANVDYLKNGSMLPPFRCDLVAKWTAIADKQTFGIG